MRYSAQLEEAKSSKVQLFPGLIVKVRTKDGRLVMDGRITDVEPSTGTVRVQNDVGGADLQVDVDLKRYTIFVVEPLGQVSQFPPEETVYARRFGV